MTAAVKQPAVWAHAWSSRDVLKEQPGPLRVLRYILCVIYRIKEALQSWYGSITTFLLPISVVDDGRACWSICFFLQRMHYIQEEEKGYRANSFFTSSSSTTSYLLLIWMFLSYSFRFLILLCVLYDDSHTQELHKSLALQQQCMKIMTKECQMCSMAPLQILDVDEKSVCGQLDISVLLLLIFSFKCDWLSAWHWHFASSKK